MGERFYQQQLDKFGTYPGYQGTNRRRRVAWTDESKQQAIDLYTEQEPTPETSMEVVKDIADELGESPNGVRMILTRAGVYVKKNPSRSGSSNGSTGGGRVSKEAMHNELKSAIQDAGQEADDDIIGRLSGKAAQYIAKVITAING
jgi:transposase-like protein